MMVRSPSALAISTIALLSAWLGGALVVAFVVAPAAFSVLPSRTLAGALVGRVLPVIFWAGIAVGLFAAAISPSLAARAVMGSSLMLAAACAVSLLVIGPRIASLRDAVGGPIDALDPADPRRLAFGRLHGLSVLGLGIGALAAIAALILLARITLAARGAAAPTHEKALQWSS